MTSFLFDFIDRLKSLIDIFFPILFCFVSFHLMVATKTKDIFFLTAKGKGDEIALRESSIMRMSSITFFFHFSYLKMKNRKYSFNFCTFFFYFSSVLSSLVLLSKNIFLCHLTVHDIFARNIYLLYVFYLISFISLPNPPLSQNEKKKTQSTSTARDVT